jgi:hypothetical protein
VSLSWHRGLGGLGDPLGLSGGLSHVASFTAPVINPNLLTKTEQFDNAAWVKTNCPVTSNAGTDPLGGSTADLLDMSFGVGAQISQTSTVACTIATGSAGASLAAAPKRFSVIGIIDGTKQYTYSVWLSDPAAPSVQIRFDVAGGFVKVSIKDTGDGAMPLAWGAKLEIGNAATGDATNYGAVA